MKTKPFSPEPSRGQAEAGTPSRSALGFPPVPMNFFRLPSALFLMLAALAASGCHYRSLTTPGGARYTSFSLGASADVKALDAGFDPATGAFRVKVGSTATDATAVAGEVLPAALKARLP